MTLIIHILIRFIEYCCDSGILLLNSWTYEKKFQIFHPYVTRGCIAWPPEWNEELEEDEKINPSFYTSAYTRDLTDSKGTVCDIFIDSPFKADSVKFMTLLQLKTLSSQVYQPDINVYDFKKWFFSIVTSLQSNTVETYRNDQI